MHADKWGPAGSVFAALCCLGVAPVLGALSAAGLGFLIHDLILIPMLALFLGVTIWAVGRDRRRHERAGPERLAWAAALLTVGGLWLSGLVVGLGLALLIGASAWNWVLVRRLREATVSAGGDA